MTKLITALIIALFLFAGWELFKYWEKLDSEHGRQQQAAPRVVSGNQLPGVPYELEQSLDGAEQQGAGALRQWLQTYGAYVHDPRLAWIELDYCVMIARTNPQEARRIFNEVKRRTPPTSPVWPRIQQLQSSYD